MILVQSHSADVEGSGGWIFSNLKYSLVFATAERARSYAEAGRCRGGQFALANLKEER